MTKQVRWTKVERDMVICRIADLLGHGSFTTIGRAAVEAQNQVLSVDRHHVESSLFSNAHGSFKGLVDAELSKRSINAHMAKKAAEEKIQEPETAEPVVIEKKAEEVEQPVQPLIQMAMGFFIESITDAFKKQLRHSLNAAAAEVLEEISNSTNVTELVGKVTGKEVSAVSSVPPVSQEVKAHKLKVAIVGGNGKGSDQAFITKGLEDVYDFRFIDSEKSVVERVRYCDLVIIRTSYCGHGLQWSAESAVDKSKVIKIGKGSPKAINEILVNHYANLPASPVLTH